MLRSAKDLVRTYAHGHEATGLSGIPKMYQGAQPGTLTDFVERNPNAVLLFDEIEKHSRKNEVLQAIGLPHGIVPDVNSRSLKDGDRVLLCSDGLWEALAEEEIRSVVEADGTMRQLAIQLVDRANRAGGYDNITVVLYEHVD